MRNSKNRIILFSILVIFCAVIIISGCDHGNKPKKESPKKESPKKEPPKETYLKAETFPKKDGKSYDGYKIKWTDASGKPQEKTITSPSDFIFEGGVKAGEKPQIIPLVKNDSNIMTEEKPIIIDPASGTPDYTVFVKAGIRNLKEEDYDKALESFEKAYKAEANNSTKTYYALVKLASISTKPETVKFMQEKIGFAKYPHKLNALVNPKEWFKKYETTDKYKRWQMIYGAEFSETPNNENIFMRVKGRVVSQNENVENAIDMYYVYEKNTVPGIQTKWVQYGENKKYENLTNGTDNNENTSYSDKKFVIESYSEDGPFMVKVPSSSLPEGQKKYKMDRRDQEILVEVPFKRSFYLPELQPAVEWYKNFSFLPFQIPAYILEKSNGNFDGLIDELYSILFGTEFNEAKAALNSIDASKPIEIDDEFLSLVNVTKDQIGVSKTEVKKDHLMGTMGALTLVKGSLEWFQSYSFNFKDISIFKSDWMSEEASLKNLGEYKQDQDPFNNGFLKGRSYEKMAQAKKDFVEGLDLVIKAYETFIGDANMPQNVKESIKHYSFIKEIVQEVRNAINDGRKADFLIGGTDNMMTKDFSEFKIDMGKVFTYEYFKLSNFFEMDGNKPKIYPAADGKSEYMNFKLKSFLEDFVNLKSKHNNPPHPEENDENIKFYLGGKVGKEIIKFYTTK